MAQHYELKNNTGASKVLQKIAVSIDREFTTNRYIDGSLKFERLDRVLHSWDYKDYQDHTDDVVYRAWRYIGKGIVSGTTRGELEIHFNSKTKEVEHIYLVA